MSRYFSELKYAALRPYEPGEQPREQTYVKLNTNESPFPPSPLALDWAASHTRSLNLYSDPEQWELRGLLAEELGVSPEELLLTNGSDEILNFAFMAFCDAYTPAAFPDITYGFYPVFAALNGVAYEEIPLGEGFRLRPEDYFHRESTLFLANPNAPTGLLVSVEGIEAILRANPNWVTVVDEAYIDFGGESCAPLVRKYDNLLVTRTFSKSRSMAGARLGFGLGCPALIADLNRVKYATNPYNVNSMTAALGVGTLRDPDYTRNNCAAIMENRAFTAEELRRRGFELTDSAANFLFARTPALGGRELYLALKERGVLVRHFDLPRIADWNRITVGSREQMEGLLAAIDGILEGRI